jgi:septal ring factor EnvC (AmiA/AmiB activator)
MQKPNADIEWYDDGMTMQEQEQWAKEHKAMRPKIRVTERQQEQWKDKMISNLKVKLAANEEYIAELNEEKEELIKTIKQLTNQIEVLNKKQEIGTRNHQKLVEKYNADLTALKQEIIVPMYEQKFQEQYDTLKGKYDALKIKYDHIFYKLVQHNGCI